MYFKLYFKFSNWTKFLNLTLRKKCDCYLFFSFTLLSGFINCNFPYLLHSLSSWHLVLNYCKPSFNCFNKANYVLDTSEIAVIIIFFACHSLQCYSALCWCSLFYMASYTEQCYIFALSCNILWLLMDFSSNKPFQSSITYLLSKRSLEKY